MHFSDRASPRSRNLPQPIPGTGVPRRGLFVSRWGGLLTRPTRGKLPDFSPQLFTPRATDRLFRLYQQRWSIYLVGNEESVANGHSSDEDWSRFEAQLVEHVTHLGICVARNYACLDDPHGKGRHRRDSVFQFPNTGVFYHAAQEDGIRLGESWLVSDDASELAGGWRAGCRIAGIAVRQSAREGELHVEPQLCAATLVEALDHLIASDEYARR